jgi:hypothetical protein
VPFLAFVVLIISELAAGSPIVSLSVAAIKKNPLVFSPFIVIIIIEATVGLSSAGRLDGDDIEGGLKMGWRSKLIFLLIIYFAGFATAIYMLAPTPGIGQTLSDGIVQSVNVAMHKAVDYGKQTAQDVGRYIQEKTEQNNPDKK